MKKFKNIMSCLFARFYHDFFRHWHNDIYQSEWILPYYKTTTLKSIITLQYMSNVILWHWYYAKLLNIDVYKNYVISSIDMCKTHISCKDGSSHITNHVNLVISLIKFFQGSNLAWCHVPQSFMHMFLCIIVLMALLITNL